MSILHIDNISLSLGPSPLLDQVCLQIEAKDKIALIGRNGEGKSTLLKIIAGIDAPDSGLIRKEKHTDVALLSQDLPEPDSRSVFDVVAAGLSDIGELLQTYHQLTLQSETHHDDPAWFRQLEQLQNEIEAKNGWEFQQRIEKVITELNLPSDALMSSLSGGWRRRVGIAQVLVRQPDLLLLDEPTNHLDIETIQWLEKLLINYPKAILFITHDRALLRKIATRIIELDRGLLTSYPSDYSTYLARKAKALEDETLHNALFDKKLAQEEVWIRQGVKARRTRNEGRVRALEQLRHLRAQRREQRANPNFNINEIRSTGKIAFDVNDVSYRYNPTKPIIEPFSIALQKSDKIALIGPNGIGKSTFIQLLIGNLEPQTGFIKGSPTNQVAFFDQNRAQLDPNKTVIDNVVEGDDFIEVQGKRKHVISYLSDFLFSPHKCQALARTLSGGEANRLMLAKLFSKPANVLVLDEPTNDLDIESLELLETLLLSYTGTVIIISHDREFIDNVATHSIAFEGQGVLKSYVGGYSDWQSYQKNVASAPVKVESSKKSDTVSPASKKRLSFNEQREYEAIPEKISALEASIQALELKLGDPLLYNESPAVIKTIADELEVAKTELARLYGRWEALEN
jgi:ATP-binding cassette subfamily F protein uup